MNFNSSLKKWFYNIGTSEAASGVRVCLLDAASNPIGSDTLERVGLYVYAKDDCVDLGLPSGRLWAKKNLFAPTEYDYGAYFSWGNLDAHQEGAGYNFNQAVYETTDGYTITSDLTLSHDAANANLGGAWRMPTADEFAELFNSDYTTSAWVADYEDSGVNGRLVTSKSNGNTLFFPASGYTGGSSIGNKGSNGRYWSSSVVSSSSAYTLSFSSSSVVAKDSNQRRIGSSIRPVM